MLVPEIVTLQPTTKTYGGRPVFEFGDGWEGIKIKTEPLSSLMGNRPELISSTWTSRARRAKSS
jgi:hypothetical protein